MLRAYAVALPKNTLPQCVLSTLHIHPPHLLPVQVQTVSSHKPNQVRYLLEAFQRQKELSQIRDWIWLDMIGYDWINFWIFQHLPTIFGSSNPPSFLGYHRASPSWKPLSGQLLHFSPVILHEFHLLLNRIQHGEDLRDTWHQTIPRESGWCGYNSLGWYQTTISIVCNMVNNPKQSKNMGWCG